MACALVALALGLPLLVLPGRAQVSYSGGTYTQNFDALPNSGGPFTLSGPGPFALNAAPFNIPQLAGWSFAKVSGSGSNALFNFGTGSSNTGSVYSFGAAGSTDRAFGTLLSGTVGSVIGVVFTNNSGTTITQFTVSYTGEQWRYGGTTGTDKLAFEYQVNGPNITTGPLTAAPALDFTSPVNGTTGGTTGALDGNAAANRRAISGTVTGIAWAPGQTLVLRWYDFNVTGSDDGLAIDDLTFTTNAGAGPVAPAVTLTNPANGAVNSSPGTSVAITFNNASTVTGTWFAITGSVSGSHSATVLGGPGTYTLVPNTFFTEGETVTVTVFGAQVTDAGTGTMHMAADYTFSFTTQTLAPLPIHTLQGNGTVSPYVGQSVSLEGIVTATFQGPDSLGGFYVQAPESAYDADPATSEGIFVFNTLFTVHVGDAVRIAGTVAEFGTAPATQTELTTVTFVNVLSAGNPLPAPVAVTLPFVSATEAERYEGMRVTWPQSLTVTDNYDLGHYGEFVLSDGRLEIPTNVVAPGAAAQNLEAANLLSQILVDDGSSVNYPDPTPGLADSAGHGLTRRAGSIVTGLTGILDQKFGSYIIEPTDPVTFTDANPRGDPPAPAGSLRICMGNVQNLMNGNGSGLDGAAGGFPTSRGASNLTEYQRQLAKATAGILGLAPDIMGLTEVENDRVTNGLPNSYGPTSALAELVASLNANAPAGTSYAYVDASAVDITTDQIHVALIYRVETVAPVGAPAMLSDPAFNNVARNPLAQTFLDQGSGQKLTVCINHFRAKGSAAAGAGNTDSGDGQGTNNALRVQEANALTAWLATDPTGSSDPDFLILGDLNSYAKEDPVTAITGAGYVNVIEKFEGEGGYSYAFNGEFGHLDHALASAHLAEQAVGGATWHANSDEPGYYDYNTENKDAAQRAINAGTPYRYADHDPVVVSLSLHPEYAAPAFSLQPQSQTVTVGDSVTFTVVATGYPAPLFRWQKGGGDLGGATTATLKLDHVTTADAGSYTAIASNTIGTTPSDPATLTVNKAPATVTLGNLAFIYDGTPKPATATTAPTGLNVDFTYDGGAAAPVNVGSYAVVATVNDANYQGSATGTLTITDGTAPVIRGLTATPSVLWPVNHKLVSVVIAADVVDDVDPSPTTRILAVSSNQPANGPGDGHTASDWVVTGPLTLNLRAERAGNAGDRVYTITVESRDQSGNASTGTVTVTVPHNQ